MKLTRKKLILLAIAALGVGLVLSYIKQQPAKQANLADLNGTVLSQPRMISNFSLIDQDGKAFTNKNFQKHWTLLFFGFTNCQMVCPTAMAKLNEIYQHLPTSRIPAQVVFVTVDPERDTTARLKEYVTSFNPDFIGVTGEPKTLSILRQELGVITIAEQGNIDHSGAIMLIDPEGDFYAIYSTPYTPEELISDYKKITAAG